jgi:iron complex outermembrane receptor protein
MRTCAADMNKTLLTAFVALSCPIVAGAADTQPTGAPDTPLLTPPSPIAATVQPADEDASPSRSLGVITVQGTRPTSLPTRIPTTTHSATREDIARTVNAMDSEDALKYFPSLLVRKRYIGDYNHAILSSRASGTGNSARSVVYADGILLSNFLGNGVGGLSFPPRWGLVTPEEIERVDVMYGPFSAAYPGNSVGAVVDYVTRMPTKFEAHAKVGYVAQPFELYDTKETFRAWQTSASVGNRAGDWSWWINANHTDSEGQPQTFATRRVQDGTASPSLGAVPVPVTGAVRGANNAGEPWYILGTGTQYHTKQDHLKVKLAYDLTPAVRASYVLGLWRNISEGNPTSYLRDASGQAVYTPGPIQIGDRMYTGPGATGALRVADFTHTRENLLHTMHGLSVKSHTRGEWDWEAAASLYDYKRDGKRQNTTALPGALSGGAGTLAQGDGTGWWNMALKGTWRPTRMNGAHVVDFGYQRDAYKLRYRTSDLPGNYLVDEPAVNATGTSAHGNTLLQSLYAQDTWKLSPRWKTVLGLRAERWEAFDGVTLATGTSIPQTPGARHETALSPKAALSWQWLPDTVLKTSLGRAVRMPTVHELYGSTASATLQNINDPDLQAERSWTTEISAEKDLGSAMARLTYFAEDTRDAIYSQLNAAGTTATVQNIDRIATSGLEAALNSENWLMDGLDLWASLTYTDSQIKENRGWFATPGDTIGKRQPNIPRWRGTALASYRFNPEWSASLGARFAGRQYRTLNNADINGDAYMGVSKFFTVDARLRWRVTKQWTAAFGIDNLNNAKYWNFHPYPQRSYSAELAFDL